MCAVCIEKAKGTITVKEALSALREVVNTDKKMATEDFDHYTALYEQLKEEDQKSKV